MSNPQRRLAIALFTTPFSAAGGSRGHDSAVVAAMDTLAASCAGAVARSAAAYSYAGGARPTWHPALLAARVLVQARFLGTLAGMTLVLAAAIYLAGTRRKHLVLTVRAAMLLYPLYLAEVIAFVYLVEILLQGSVTYLTPAIAIAPGASAVVFLWNLWQYRALEAPAPRVRGLALDRALQPEFFAVIDAGASGIGGVTPDHVVLVMAPQVQLMHDGAQVEGETLNGRVMVVSFLLAGMLTHEEFRCAVGHCFAFLRFFGGKEPPGRAAFLQAQRMRLRIAEAFRASGLRGLGALGMIPAVRLLELSSGPPAPPAVQTVFGMVSDRTVAARLGSLDQARALVKAVLAAARWPRFLAKVETEIKRGPNPEYDRLAMAFGQFVESMSYRDLCRKLADRTPLKPGLEALGLHDAERWQDLDLYLAEPAADLLRDRERLESELSKAERALLVLERG